MIELTIGEVIFISDSLREIADVSDAEAYDLIDECQSILEPHINNTGEVDEST